MPKSINDRNLKRLYAELGFGNGLPGRGRRALDDKIARYPLDSLNRENPRPFWTKDSKEAKDLAIEFCEHGQRAKKLWPNNSHGNWPSWSNERNMYVPV